MKSLDEVIKKIEKQWVCPSSDEADEYCELYEVRDDALHYLKEYRDDRENFSEAISNCGKALNKYIMDINALAQQEENLPLTWNELRTMEGKPVWVEEIGRKYSTPHWAIHNGIMDGYDGDENLYLEPFEVLTKYTLGKTWQAYRREK